MNRIQYQQYQEKQGYAKCYFTKGRFYQYCFEGAIAACKIAGMDKLANELIEANNNGALKVYFNPRTKHVNFSANRRRIWLPWNIFRRGVLCLS